MKTDSKKSGNHRKADEPVKQQDKNKNTVQKKPVYIKDMPPIDVPQPGIL